MAAPFWHSVELNAVRELHGFLLKELPMFPFAPIPSPVLVGLIVAEGGKKFLKFERLLGGPGLRARLTLNRRQDGGVFVRSCGSLGRPNCR